MIRRGGARSGPADDSARTSFASSLIGWHPTAILLMAKPPKSAPKAQPKPAKPVSKSKDTESYAYNHRSRNNLKRGSC
jgi:hypothetical protein